MYGPGDRLEYRFDSLVALLVSGDETELSRVRTIIGPPLIGASRRLPPRATTAPQNFAFSAAGSVLISMWMVPCLMVDSVLRGR